MNPITGVYEWWVAIPRPARVQMRALAKTTLLTCGTVLGTLWGTYVAPPFSGNPNDGVTFLEFIPGHWFGGAFGLFLAWVIRSKDASAASANTVLLPSGALATLITQPTDGTVYPPAPRTGPASSTLLQPKGTTP